MLTTALTGVALLICAYLLLVAYHDRPRPWRCLLPGCDVSGVALPDGSGFTRVEHVDAAHCPQLTACRSCARGRHGQCSQARGAGPCDCACAHPDRARYGVPFGGAR